MTCGALASTKLIPELNYWFNYAMTRSVLNKHQIPIPPTFDSTYLSIKSFIELLFNENYSYDEYKYFYEEYGSAYSWPSPIRERIMVYANSAKCYKMCCDATTNIFILQQDDLTMLDGLLAYRQDETGVTLIDTTGVTQITGSQIAVNYDALSTCLSKLIYHYLNLKINGSYSAFDNQTLISCPQDVLASCYEAYVIEEVFQHISLQGT